jgi:hypothetical protein
MAHRQLEGQYEARVRGDFRGVIADGEFEGVLEGNFEGRAEMDTSMSRGERIHGQRNFNREEVQGYIEEGKFMGSIDGVILGAYLEGEFDGEMSPL